MPGLRVQQDRDSHQPSRPPNFNTSGTLQPRSRRHRGPLCPQPGLQVPSDDDRQNYPLARSCPYCEHDSGHCRADVPGDLGLAIRRPLHRDIRPRCSVHLGGVANGPHQARHQHQLDNSLPPPVLRNCGEIPQNAEKRPALRHPQQQIVDAISPLGDAWPPQRSKARHGDLDGRDSLWSTATHPRTVFPVRTIAAALHSGATRTGKIKHRRSLPSSARPHEVQVLALHREATAYGRLRLCSGRQTGQAEPCLQIHRPV